MNYLRKHAKQTPGSSARKAKPGVSCGLSSGVDDDGGNIALQRESLHGLELNLAQ